MTAGPTELIVILVIFLLLFGAKKLPDLANSMGRSIKEFRRASADLSPVEPDDPPDPHAR